MYILFMKKRPTQDPESRFYLTVNRYWDKKPDASWFTAAPMGKDTLGNIAKVLSEKAGFSAKHSNHSGRKTFITNLLDSGCAPTEVAQLSGHKNLASLNHYHTLSLQRQQELSDIIHNPIKRAKSETITTPSTEQVDDFNVQEDDMSDGELVASSQEIERTLQNITSYEQVPDITRPVQSVNLPIHHSPGGSLSLTQFRSNPQSLFSNCTFNSPLTIIMKQ